MRDGQATYCPSYAAPAPLWMRALVTVLRRR